MSTIPELLQKGVQLCRGNQFAEARQIYQQVLELDPNHAAALNLLGLLSWQTGQFEQAVDHLRKAIAIDRSRAAYFANLGEAYRGLNRYDEAVENYQEALRLKPAVSLGHLRFGTLLQEAGHLDRAIDSYERALQLDPRCLETLIRLGIARKRQGNLAAAEDCFRRASEAHPSAAVAYYELGNVQQMARRFEEAIANYRQAIGLQPNDADVICNLGIVLRAQGHLSEALAQLRHAVELRPDMGEAIADLGMTLQELGRPEDAQQYFERALELEPGRAEFLFNMGTVLKDQTRVHGALDSYERALQAQPGYVLRALYNRGTARLSLGQFAEGWADYEHRLVSPQYNMLRFSQPLWDGSPLDGRRLLVQCEQGLGDTLQFIRYLPLVRSRGEKVTVAADAPLAPLLERSGYGPLVSSDGPLPPFDVHVPLMSLPHIFGTQVDSVPADVPYLSVEEARVERWRAELEKYPGFKVGIAWQGSTSYRLDRLRSIPLQRYAPLAQVAGVRLVSLQKGPGTEQVAALAGKFDVVDLDRVLDNEGAFLDTAAAMQSLDLVISSDSAVAHLAGALGVPVWLALSLVPDWRWMLGRDDSPWYPTMRLFRQTEPGQWPDVFARMADELGKLVANLSPK